ncbi:rho GTPase-activating protein 40 isoform X3, partial [Lates japonicus]
MWRGDVSRKRRSERFSPAICPLSAAHTDTDLRSSSSWKHPPFTTSRAFTRRGCGRCFLRTSSATTPRCINVPNFAAINNDERKHPHRCGRDAGIRSLQHSSAYVLCVCLSCQEVDERGTRQSCLSHDICGVTRKHAITFSTLLSPPGISRLQGNSLPGAGSCCFLRLSAVFGGDDSRMPWGRSGSAALLLLSGRAIIGRAKARDPSPTEMSVEPWASPQDQAAAEHAQHSTHALPAPDQEQHPDKLCLDSFWSEVETIRQGSGYADLDSTRRDSRQSEEGEQEEQWLADAGLSTLISEDSGDVDNVVLLSTLTRTQAEAVQRRLDSYTLSLRKRNKPAPRDVRDIFHSPIAQTHLPEAQHSEDLAQNSMASVAKTPLSAVTPEHQRCAPKEEFFITDVAYCEQAVIFLKQAKLPQLNIQRRKEDGTLPRVICPKCRLGVTRIQDLSHTDMKKVRQLALIDMTALCDLLELEVKRHKTGKRKIPESSLFGVQLATLLENDQKVKPNTATPLFLQALLSFLEKKGVDSEGILRVPGSQSRIKLLQQNLEANFYSGQVSWDDVSPNDAAALLKKFIRELPAPLLTAEYLNTFSAVR